MENLKFRYCDFAFNRTNKELKQLLDSRKRYVKISFNRTNKELKHIFRSYITTAYIFF